MSARATAPAVCSCSSYSSTRTGHLNVRTVRKLSTKPLTQRSLALPPHRRQVQQIAAPSHACSSAAASPGAEPSRPLLSTIVAAVAVLLKAVSSAMQRTAERLQQQPDAAVLNKSIKQSVRHFHMLGAIAPFAAASGGANTFLLLTKAMARFIKIYLLLLFLRVLLSWFPAFNWERQPWLGLRQMTDPYLNLYRGLVPPLLGTIDFTPLLGFFILQYISGVLESGAAEDELDEWW
ncbi:g9689 [Coccomyxa viridis]|uniref:G9689 protein n=1 Tax=Coccomyxa viridis TaxID=1274662 RepID=A0ABP1G7T1_9CHLO